MLKCESKSFFKAVPWPQFFGRNHFYFFLWLGNMKTWMCVNEPVTVCKIHFCILCDRWETWMWKRELSNKWLMGCTCMYIASWSNIHQLIFSFQHIHPAPIQSASPQFIKMIPFHHFSPWNPCKHTHSLINNLLTMWSYQVVYSNSKITMDPCKPA